MSSIDHRAVLTHHFARKLESKGLDDEILEVLKEKEAINLSKFHSCRRTASLHENRQLSYSFLAHCARQHPLEECIPSCYISAVQLFDLAPQSTLVSDAAPHDVLAVAAAAWLVSLKMNGKSDSITAEVQALALLAEEMMGLPAISCSEIAKMERAFLLGSNASAPTAATWCSLFATRLNIFLNGALEKCDHWNCLQVCCWDMIVLAMHSMRVSWKNSPYEIALGSFCLALAAVKLVPLVDFIDLNFSHISAQTSETPNFEAKLAWLIQNFSSQGTTSLVPSGAIFAATELAALSNPESMRRATTILVTHIPWCQFSCLRRYK